MKQKRIKLTALTGALLFLIFYMPLQVNAQACGEGVFSLEVYSLNESESETVSYQIYPINLDSLASTYQVKTEDDYVYSRYSYNWVHGAIIQPKIANSLRDTSNELSIEKFDKTLRHLKNSRSGEFKNGVVQFKTSETHLVPYLLKLHSKSREVWVIAYLMGACDRTVYLLWKDRPQLVQRE